MAAGPILYQAPGADTANLPGGDPYAANAGQAAQDVERQRQQALSGYGIAAQAGKQAVIDATAKMNSARDAAMQQQMAEARQRNAPQAAIDEIQNRIAAPYANYEASMQAGDAARQQDIAYRTAALNSYMSQVAPAVQGGHDRALSAYQRERAQQDAQRAYEQAQLENQVAMAKFQAQQDQLNREWQQAQAEREFNYKVAFDKQQFDEDVRRWGLEFAQKQQEARDAAARARSGGGGGGGRSGSGSSGYFGTGMSKTDLTAALPGMIGKVQQTYGPIGTAAAFGASMGAGQGLNVYTAHQMEDANKMPSGVLAALLPKFVPPKDAAPPAKNVVYGQADAIIRQELAKGTSPQEIIRMARSSNLYGQDSTAVNNAIADDLPGWG